VTGCICPDLSLDRFTAQLQLALAEKAGQRQWKAEGKGRLTGLERRERLCPRRWTAISTGAERRLR
jgi:hypothetical protein